MRKDRFHKEVQKDYPYLVRFAQSRHMPGARERVHDTIAAVGAGSYRSFKQVDATVRTWLTQALIYVNVMHLRERSKAPDIISLHEEIEAEDVYAAIDLKVAIEKRISKLPPRARRIFYLIFVEGWEIGECADKIGVHRNTVAADLKAHVKPALEWILSEYTSNPA